MTRRVIWTLLVGAGSQVQVDVLERRAMQLEVGQLVVVLERPTGEREQRGHRIVGGDPNLAVAVCDRGADSDRQLGRLDPRRDAEADLGRELRPVSERARGTGRDDLALHDHPDPVRETLGLVHVVGREHDRRTTGPQGADQAPHRSAGGGIEAGRGLVEEQQLGVADQRQRDVEPPALAARQLLAAPRPELGQLELRQRLVQAARRRVVPGIQRQALADSQLGLGEAVLQHDPDPLPPGTVAVLGIDAEHLDLAARARTEALEHLQRRRLPGPVGAQQREDLPALDLKVDATDRLEAPIAAPQPADGQRRTSRRTRAGPAAEVCGWVDGCCEHGGQGRFCPPRCHRRHDRSSAARTPSCDGRRRLHPGGREMSGSISPPPRR
jgi:hypothetical protein